MKKVKPAIRLDSTYSGYDIYILDLKEKIFDLGRFSRYRLLAYSHGF